MAAAVASWYRLVVSSLRQATQILSEFHSVQVTVAASLRARQKPNIHGDGRWQTHWQRRAQTQQWSAHCGVVLVSMTAKRAGRRTGAAVQSKEILKASKNLRPVTEGTIFCAPNDPPACPAWGWGRTRSVSASRESRLQRSTLHGEILCRNALSVASTARRSTEAHAAAVRRAIPGIRRQQV